MWLCIYVCVYVNTNVNVAVNTYVCIYIYCMCLHIYVYICHIIHLWSYVIYIYMYTLCIYMYCLYWVYTYIYICVYKYMRHICGSTWRTNPRWHDTHYVEPPKMYTYPYLRKTINNPLLAKTLPETMSRLWFV